MWLDNRRCEYYWESEVWFTEKDDGMLSGDGRPRILARSYPSRSRKSSSSVMKIDLCSCFTRSSLSMLWHTLEIALMDKGKEGLAYRASTLASSPSTPTMACGILASTTWKNACQKCVWKCLYINARSDYRNADSIHRSPHTSSYLFGMPFCTSYTGRPSP